MNIFDCLYKCTNINVDMTIIFVDQICVIRDDNTIIKKNMFIKTISIIVALVQRIALCINACMFLKNLGKIFGTLTISVKTPLGDAWTMNHALQNKLKRKGSLFSFRNLAQTKQSTCAYSRILSHDMRKIKKCI